MRTEALHKLHRIHQQLTSLRDQLARGPKQVQAARANVDRLKQRQENIYQKYQQSRISSDEKQLQLKTAEDRITDMKRKRNECSTNKEFQTLIEQIAADEMATSVLSDEILELMEKTDEHKIVSDEATVQVDKATDEMEIFRKRVDDQRDSLETEIARQTSELVEAERALPIEIKVEYDRVVKARGEDALATIDEEMCGGCYQLITSQMLNELQMSRPVFCKACGRLLYLAEAVG